MGDAFALACFRGNLDDVRQFLAEGADPNTMHSQGFPALVMAAQEGHVEAVEALALCGVRVKVPRNTRCFFLLKHTNLPSKTLMVGCPAPEPATARTCVPSFLFWFDADVRSTLMPLSRS